MANNILNLDSIFKILKYVLIIANVLIIFGSLFICATGRDLGELPELKSNHTVLVFACMMVIIFCLIGIAGAYKAHFGLTITYSILMTIALILELAELSSEDVGSFMISVIILVCAFSYAFLIKRIEKLDALRRSFSHETGKI